MRRLVVGILGDGPDAEDAWQETWLSLWRARTRLRAGTPWAFVRTTAVRKAIGIRRRNAPGPLPEEPADDLAPVVEVPDMRRLPRRERASLVLYFWEGLSLAEIAEVLEAPVNTVKTWMHRARRRLRQSLCEEETS